MGKNFLVLAGVAAFAALALGIGFSQTFVREDSATCTTTTTSTVFYTGAVPFIQVVSSQGRCGSMDEAVLEVVEKELGSDGYVVTLLYREAVPNPCHQHRVVKAYFNDGNTPMLEITLEAVSTAETCIQCVGVVETLIQTGPLPIGAVVVVNGVEAAV